MKVGTFYYLALIIICREIPAHKSLMTCQIRDVWSYYVCYVLLILPTFKFLFLDSSTQVDNDNGANQWNNLLLDVQNKSRKKLPENKNVLLLGDSKSGKTTLVTKLQGLKDSKQGWGMEYGYIQV